MKHVLLIHCFFIDVEWNGLIGIKVSNACKILKFEDIRISK